MSTTISCFYHRSKSNSVEYRVYHCVTSNCDPSKSDKGTSVHIIASTSSLFKQFFGRHKSFFPPKICVFNHNAGSWTSKIFKKISLRENPKWWLKDVNRSQAISYYIDRMNWYKMNWCKKGRKKTNNFFLKLHTTFIYGSSDCPQKALNLPVLTFFYLQITFF